MKPPIVNRFSSRTRKIAYWLAGLLVLYAVTGFLILPPIIRAVAIKQLAKQLNRQVSIQSVRLNPFALSASVRGLLITDADGQPFVSWDEVYVNMRLSSFLGHPWVFQRITVRAPFARVQVNKDSSLNFSDIIARNSTNAPAKQPSKPLALRVDRLQVFAASASLTDLTPRSPFKRVIGPLDLTLMHFRTDPDSRNPYSFQGTTDAGEKIGWSGSFYLSPVRSEGELAFDNISLNKYAPLYQDFVRFLIKDGVVSFHSNYRFELSSSNRIAAVTNAAFTLQSFKLADPRYESNIVELPDFSVTGASADAGTRRAEVGSIAASGARLALRRNKDATVNVIELSRPSEEPADAPGAVLLLLRSVTNAVAMLLNSTNEWTAAIQEVNLTNCALSLDDLVNSRPVHLDLDNVMFRARHISNVPGSNLTASLSLRWNTNGTIKTDIQASFSPPTADVHLDLDRVELRPLDPYLESKLNVLIRDSKLGLDGQVRLRTPKDRLPEVTFHGDARLDDFATVDGVQGEELLKWSSVQVIGIDGNLNPPAIAIKQIVVDDAYARVIIETNRTINLLAALRMADTNAEPSTPAQPTRPAKPSGNASSANQANSASAVDSTNSAALPKISLAEIVISNAQVRFTDRSVTPNVNMAVDQLAGTIKGISSDELEHAKVELGASVDNVGPVEITGTINPLSPSQTNEIKITVRNMDLTPASPYVGKFAGYELAKGKLRMDLDYHLAGRNLKAQNLIELDQFTFGDRVNSPEATKLPVRLAVAILKDRDGKIQLDVPVEGSLDDPQFRLHKVIVRAIVNLLTKIATSPFAALSAVFGGRGEEMSYQDFAAGSFEIQPASREKLDALAKGLYERPGLQLEISGSVDPKADRDALSRANLDHQLHVRKWLSLRKSERETTSPDQLPLAPDERISLTKKLCDEAIAKGEIHLTNSSQATNAIPLFSPTPPPPLETDKGATQLMRHARPRPLQPEEPSLSPGQSGSATAADQMEAALLGTISITDNDLETLAANRATAVRAYILQTGKVEAGRLFLTDKAGALKTQGSRAYLQLQ